jgi:hypothetical protein
VDNLGCVTNPSGWCISGRRSAYKFSTIYSVIPEGDSSQIPGFPRLSHAGTAPFIHMTQERRSHRAGLRRALRAKTGSIRIAQPEKPLSLNQAGAHGAVP